MRELPHITERSQLNSILKKGQITIIKAGATWCGPCQQIAPLVNECSPPNTSGNNFFEIIFLLISDS